MKLKISVAIIVVLLIILIFRVYDLLIRDNITDNSKIIYCSDSEDTRGSTPFLRYILIYDNGVIKEEEITTGEKKKNKLTNQELNELKDLIKDVEESQLISTIIKEDSVLGNGSFKYEKYINLNKKIVIYTGNPDSITTYTNDKVERLNEFIENLEEKYLKEE